MRKQKTPEDFLADYAPPLEEQFFSLGFSCQIFNITPNQLDVLMREADVKFSRTIDGVMYVDGRSMEKLTEVFNRLMDEITDAARTVAAAPNN
jgi:hypothetical protein